MKILSLSWFGFTMLTLVHAVSIPVTDEPVSPAEDDLVITDIPDTTIPEDGEFHWDFSCPDGWTKHSTQCLLFVPQNMTWNEAKENCASKGEGSLAGVHEETQANEISKEMKSAGHHGGPVWVGGRKTSKDSSWSWVDSTFDGFAEFCDKKSSDDENSCLEISFGDDDSGCLSGMKCDAELPSVCGILIY